MVDGLKWWHGAWIQYGIPTFRPLSSYLYWTECWVGFHWGFLWPALFGFCLFVGNCLLASALALRLTKLPVCAVLAGVLAAHVRFHNVGQPDFWLAWFPVHQELLMNGLMLGALVCFDVWFERAETKYLGWSWVLFVVGCLVKEQVYVFPAFAGAVVLCRRRNAKVTLRDGLLQAGGMLLLTCAFFAYRAAIIEHVRNPNLKPIQFVSKPLTFLFPTFGRYLLTREWWLPGLATLLVACPCALRRLRSRHPGCPLTTPYAALVLTAVAALLYLRFATPSFGNAVGALGEVFRGKEPRDLLRMISTLYALYLLWRYRREEPTVMALALVCLVHLPILDFIGWHYTLSPWCVWCPYYALMAKLVWRNAGRPSVVFGNPPVLQWEPELPPGQPRLHT
ncbi:MAG: hypothetical protein COY42_27415 [Armatimonadetes bacterium CG_4_10_14_0_8_um_filter_66_14]|nr:MAG: hypothetical protein COY42_27415 [Armatimonadetes bacterium CG_4_10_14_0_8_um_filter_66_14]PJB67499.1 MAG: hypothetical protein CO096_15905 [Armatimonadetes bacterium CG_4_9_14_3_um_filter_66_14]